MSDVEERATVSPRRRAEHLRKTSAVASAPSHALRIAAAREVHRDGVERGGYRRTMSLWAVTSM